MTNRCSVVLAPLQMIDSAEVAATAGTLRLLESRWRNRKNSNHGREQCQERDSCRNEESRPNRVAYLAAGAKQ